MKRKTMFVSDEFGEAFHYNGVYGKHLKLNLSYVNCRWTQKLLQSCKPILLKQRLVPWLQVQRTAYSRYDSFYSSEN